MKTIKAKLIPTWFTKQNATLNICPNIDEDAIYEYLAILIQDGTIEIPGFILSGYTVTKFNEDVIVHNFYYKQTDRTLTYCQIQGMLREHPILSECESQPMPTCTYHNGSLYITIIAES